MIAHASFGHNSFFKNNYLFETWTDASSIIDYLVFSKNYIAECEERYGIDVVEDLVDSCHALMNYGVDRYKRPNEPSLKEEKTTARQGKILAKPSQRFVAYYPKEKRSCRRST